MHNNHEVINGHNTIALPWNMHSGLKSFENAHTVIQISLMFSSLCSLICQ